MNGRRRGFISPQNYCPRRAAQPPLPPDRTDSVVIEVEFGTLRLPYCGVLMAAGEAEGVRLQNAKRRFENLSSNPGLISLGVKARENICL